MSGQKTRLGFFGSQGSPAPKKDSLAARTVMGHEVCLPQNEQNQPETCASALPVVQAAEEAKISQFIAEEVTLPVVRSSTHISNHQNSNQLDTNHELIPAPSKDLRTVLLVLLVAAGSFFIVWLLLRNASNAIHSMSPPPPSPNLSSKETAKPIPHPALPIVMPERLPPGMEPSKTVKPPVPPPKKRAKRHLEPAPLPHNPDELMPLSR